MGWPAEGRGGWNDLKCRRVPGSGVLLDGRTGGSDGPSEQFSRTGPRACPDPRLLLLLLPPLLLLYGSSGGTATAEHSRRSNLEVIGRVPGS